ncbi:unnamed protein product [Moneuplotes crassus]|uniref:Uncharacterized protein n=1 Tax=Euplotes crassus TaxID=5936 RepID=A0AAD2DC25_EUPCR|nr:unnamed protein product [Moneuplotes crassus]
MLIHPPVQSPKCVIEQLFQKSRNTNFKPKSVYFTSKIGTQTKTPSGYPNLGRANSCRGKMTNKKILANKAQIITPNDCGDPRIGWLTTISSKKSLKVPRYKPTILNNKFPLRSQGFQKNKNILEHKIANQQSADTKIRLLNATPHEKSLLKNRVAYNKIVLERVNFEKKRRGTNMKKYLHETCIVRKDIKRANYYILNTSARNSQFKGKI